ncbi:DUF4402 domain-containing protein [Salinimicrobium sp. TH3]|uniref:DUF4402 domain-containing protein n=1 Tax=Salinimicrobium sp. TH3 TaxID=2997342 RepID=UPI002272F469|nr:DUF4402 domain-containing protein [Salinimicrobium sp. TH3]MCY2687069.1 DUF4402 domain-containing protein [Salinimicrobium sp. TH3]
MKKITFILFALIAGTTFAQNSVNGTALAKAEIVKPLTISSEGALNFGTIAAPDADTDVVLTTANVRNMPTSMSIPGNLVTGVPTFTVTKEAGLTYKVVTGSTNLKLSGETDMVIKDITTNLTALEGATAETFKVGATITVNKDQSPGDYEGQVSVTVSYE